MNAENVLKAKNQNPVNREILLILYKRPHPKPLTSFYHLSTEN